MQRELDVAVALARRAGDEILEFLGGEFAVEHKLEDEGPVTTADRRADGLIREELAKAFPEDALLSEESPDDLARLGRRRVWIVDPLDGTRQFVRRETEFSVLIGLAVDGRATVGVVHLPCEGLTYAAAAGLGAREFGPEGRVRELHLDPARADGADPTVVVSREHYGKRTRQVVERLGPGRVIASGSVGRKAMLVASGQADIYVTTSGRSRHWDACAPEIIVREAGGVFRDGRGHELTYNTELTRNSFGLLVCRSGLLAAAVDAVEAVLCERP